MLKKREDALTTSKISSKLKELTVELLVQSLLNQFHQLEIKLLLQISSKV